ncbi:MAG: phenylalanine--tRNA ligase subunit alpha, partial [Xanthomonadales bacterium]|nr:phenylalanine--tRNA ligase subunit alpha [Xanthomonadales bacterium]
MDSLSSRIDAALQAIASAATLEALDAERVAVVGKSGFVTEQLKQLGRLPAEERKAAGERINVAKNTVLEAIAARRNALDEAAFEARLANDRVDVTLPGRRTERANLHPVTRAMERICEIFARLGYDRVDGPEIEDDWH